MNLQVKMYGLKDVLCDSLGHTTASMPRFCFALIFGFFFFGFIFKFCFEGRLQGLRVELRGQGDEWDQDVW